MKKLVVLFTFLLLAGVASFFAYSWWQENSVAPSNNETKVRFVIVKGQTAENVSNRLFDEGLIKNAFAFKFYTQLTGTAKKIQAGEYSLSANLDLVEIVDLFLQGPIELWVTIPEGLRREQIAERFVKGLEMSTAEAVSFREDFLDASANMEGYLFPDTYLFPRDASAQQIVDRMKYIFDTQIDEEDEKAIAASKYSLDEIVTLASIVEREAITKSERPLVAGVLYKRLENDWPIQADATLQYITANLRCKGISDCDWWEVPLASDKEINSTYNTYKYTGLPPGPIANPGASSLKAAIHPEESEYWYYLHDPDGQIHFAKDLAGHNRNIRKYLWE